MVTPSPYESARKWNDDHPVSRMSSQRPSLVQSQQGSRQTSLRNSPVKPQRGRRHMSVSEFCFRPATGFGIEGYRLPSFDHGVDRKLSMRQAKSWVCKDTKQTAYNVSLKAKLHVPAPNIYKHENSACSLKMHRNQLQKHYVHDRKTDI